MLTSVARAVEAGELLAEWRAPATVLAPTLASWLADPAAEVRYRAAFLLAGTGIAAPYADQLATAAADPTMRDSRTRTTVGHAALWALTRIGDPRCVPGLVARLDSLEPAGYGAYFPRVPHIPWLPSVPEVLASVPQHGQELLPLVRQRLRAVARSPYEPDAWSWAGVAEAWGDAAADAVGDLIELLKHDETWWPAARGARRHRPRGRRRSPPTQAQSPALPQRGHRSRLGVLANRRGPRTAAGRVRQATRSGHGRRPHRQVRGRPRPARLHAPQPDP